MYESLRRPTSVVSSAPPGRDVSPNRALPSPATAGHRLADIGVVQRQGSYIPDIDGPYGHNYSDGASTAGGAFNGTMKNQLFDLNANRGIDPETAALIHISDEDDHTMLTREASVIAEVDHIYPASQGGSNSHRNAAVISKESNSFQSNTYPKEYAEEYDGTRVLMGHSTLANGTIRGHALQFNVPAYQQFHVNGSGAGATIDMSDHQYLTQVDANAPALAHGMNDVTPTEARTLGILPGWVPDPK